MITKTPTNFPKPSSIRETILRYFSQELQYDESLVGTIERNHLQKQMINWAMDKKLREKTTSQEVSEGQ